jgi:hypothetical protein
MGANSVKLFDYSAPSETEDAPDAGSMPQAYDLLFERRSCPDIAERIGGGWTANGIRRALRNPIWKGVRRYSLDREEPLEVKVIDKPLISPERWQAAQQIILEKRSRWAKTKRPPHVLLSGMLRCAWGKPCYVRCGGRGRGHYYCSTGFPGQGPRCGARSVQQEAADQTVERIISTNCSMRLFCTRCSAGSGPTSPHVTVTRPSWYANARSSRVSASACCA